MSKRFFGGGVRRLFGTFYWNFIMGTRSIGTNSDDAGGAKLIYPAANRNKEPILELLKKVLINKKSTFLEVSSGSGQHIAHFAPHFLQIKFQPSECEDDLLKSINIYAAQCSSQNIKEGVFIDITQDLSRFGFEPNSIDYIYNANMMHIAPFECTVGLFENAGKYLKENGTLITYGPYAVNGILTPQSNVDFNRSLKQRDPSWGIRDISQLNELASSNGISLHDSVDLPANNKCLIWIKTSSNK